MKLEFFPNELLLNLFEYFQILHIFQLFYNLNSRFHHLVLLYCRKCHLNFQSIAKTDFDLICQTYLPLFSNQIQSLYLSDDDNTPQQITQFFSYNFHLSQFTHLEKLVLSNVYSSSILDKLINQLSYLPSLTHLSFINCHMSINQTDANDLYNQIWNLSKLSFCYIDIHFSNGNYFPSPISKSSTIKYLYIPNIHCYLNELIHLFQSTLSLQYLTIDFHDYSNTLNLKFPILSLKRLKISFNSSLNILKGLLKNTPELFYLTLDTYNIYMNGYQWEEFIEKYLLKLKIFQFKMRFSSLNHQSKEIELNQIFQSFQTKFWIDKHQWFIRCHWHTSNLPFRQDFIDLFTLPYAFNDFLSYTGCTLIKSTDPSDDQYWSYNHVKNLCYGSSQFTNSLISRIRFSNIEYLSLSLPFNEQFLIIIDKFHRLKSLSISIYRNPKVDNIQSQLQILFDRASHLYSLSVGRWSLTGLQVPLMENTSQSIRRLNLQNYVRGKNSRYFDDEQCRKLIHSPLGKQCEMLLIKVKNRRNIIDLVNYMSNLRALNVRCEDDDWTNENQRILSPQDELVEWLRDCLPSSCLVTRDTYHSQDVRLWIR